MSLIKMKKVCLHCYSNNPDNLNNFDLASYLAQYAFFDYCHKCYTRNCQTIEVNIYE